MRTRSALEAARRPAKHVAVVASFRFVAMHCWPCAPDWCAYLRSLHRHEFHARVEARVDSGESALGHRVIEICRLKEQGQEAARTAAALDESRTWSCEQWAAYLMEALQADRVEVMEDGENGAVVCR